MKGWKKWNGRILKVRNLKIYKGNQIKNLRR